MARNVNSRSATDVPQRVESDDDLDLLTYNEARVRLAEEVLAEQLRFDELARIAVGTDPEAAVRAEASAKRLAALRERLEGTKAPRITATNADEFYGTHLVQGRGRDGSASQ